MQCPVSSWLDPCLLDQRRDTSGVSATGWRERSTARVRSRRLHMSQTTITAIVVVAVIIVVVIALLAWPRTRLRRRFGPEYDRAVDERGSTVAAERELLARERRYRRLDIK